jgi:Domain of unknown function (DUF4143)
MARGSATCCSHARLHIAALRTGPHPLLTDLKYFGYLFEAVVVRDLRVFAEVVDVTVQYHRDSDDLEIDAVVTAGDGRWAACEVKLGQADIDVAAANLLAFARKVVGHQRRRADVGGCRRYVPVLRVVVHLVDQVLVPLD